jgi:tRNA A-37 threonylcarbamoyl transferase component Bud32
VANSEPGPLIGRGRNADVFDIGGGRVLRRYRDGRAPLAVAREAEVMTHARAHGVPVPEVFDVSGYDIVMERAAGPTMLDVLMRRPWTLRTQARLLARMHAVVHAVPAPGWLPAPFGDGPSLLHHDLHPMNVILTAQGPTIIDWEGGARGPASADIAMTWVIVAFSEVPGPRLQAAAAGALATAFARTFLRAAGVADRSWLGVAARHRLGDANLLPSERARLERLLRDESFPGAGETGGPVLDN